MNNKDLLQYFEQNNCSWDYDKLLTYTKELGIVLVKADYTHIFFKEGIALMHTTKLLSGEMEIVFFDQENPYITSGEISLLKEVRELLDTTELLPEPVGLEGADYKLPDGKIFGGICNVIYHLCSRGSFLLPTQHGENICSRLYSAFKAMNPRAKVNRYELFFPSGEIGLQKRKEFLDEIIKNYSHEQYKV